jgi:gag-polypeptide of LTR copia-type
MWGKFDARYAIKNTNKKVNFMTAVHNRKLTHNESMSDHVGELETLLARLEEAGTKMDADHTNL